MNIRGARVAQVAAEPLARFIRRQRTWPGGGWIEITVARPWKVAEAFGPRGTISTASDLTALAGLTWFLPPEWRDGVLHLIDWRRHVEGRLTRELQRHSLYQPQRGAR